MPTQTPSNGDISTPENNGRVTTSARAVLEQIKLLVPPLQKTSRKKKLTSNIPVQRWQELFAHPDVQLREMAHFVSSVNREDVITLDRIYVAEITLQAASPAINKIYNRYLQDEEFPEPEQRRDILVSAIELVQQLIIAYKWIFQQEFKSFDSTNKIVRDRVRHAGFRILELTQTEQRLYALIYQKLPETSWRDCNQVFFVHWVFGQCDEPKKLSGCLTIKPDRLKKTVTFTGEQPKSVRQIYTAIQIFGMADAHTWPNLVLHMVDAYLSLLSYKLNINTYQETPFTEGQLIIDFDQDHAPGHNKHYSGKPSLTIDIIDIWRLLKKDHDALAGNSEKPNIKISPALATLSDMERRPLIDVMMKKLRTYKRVDNRNSATDLRTFKINIGFLEAHQSLLESSYQNAPTHGKRHFSFHLFDLQENSQETNLRNVEEQWLLVDESKGGIRIRTHETQNTKKIFIGQIVSFFEEGLGGNDLQLGYICRINRSEDHEIDVSIIRLNAYTECVIVQDPNRPNTNSAARGFLVRSDSINWQLMLQSAWQINANQDLLIHRNNHVYPITIGEPFLQQREFIIFDLATTQ